MSSSPTDTVAVRDSPASLAAVGTLAYIGETLGHEAVGHGGACLLTGGRVTAVTPLWMHCTVQTSLLVLSGPLFNVVFGIACGAMVYARPRPGLLTLFLWLSCAFNLLVACGYLAVGGAVTFGDWAYLLAGLEPAGAWRASAVILGLLGYYAVLRGLGRLYLSFAGPFGSETLAIRTLWPGASAAVVACAAVFASGHADLASLALTLGCTLFVGWSLSRIYDFGLREQPMLAHPWIIGVKPGWIAAAVLASLAFVLLVGRISSPG